jgi:hypothetical protein
MNQSIPKWLKDLQENSWELEILISGGAIFTLFQVSEIWINWMADMAVISYLPGRTFFMLAGTLGIEILKLGFILHLILRAFWLSMVCINYVYPKGIAREKIKWKKPFSVNVEENDDLHEPILNVDRLCGIVMYLSIISSFLLTGIIFTIFMIFSFPMLLGIDIGIIGQLLFIFFLIYLFDLIFDGLLRKIPYLSYLTFLIFKLYDFLTFRFVYQKAAHLFRSNIPKWQFILSAVVFLAVSITLSYLNTYNVMKWPNVFDARSFHGQLNPENPIMNYRFYKDELDENTSSSLHIQSKFIQDDHLEIFVQYRLFLDELINALPKDPGTSNLSEFLEIAIDDSVYLNVDWFETVQRSSINKGLTAIIPIQHLTEGKHLLRIGCSDKVSPAKVENYEEKCVSVVIPFWKEEINWKGLMK